MDKGILTILGITVVVVAVVFGVALNSASKEAKILPRDKCVQHSGLGMHIHPELEIIMEGEKVAIPADIGIRPDCMRAVHTHDESGTLHLEYFKKHDFTLGDFFAVWGQPFSSTELMDKQSGDTHTISMTVDGQPNSDYQNLVLKDKQKVVIRYEKK